MESNVTKFVPKQISLERVEQFQKTLQNEPKAENIKVNKMANNSKFVPIGVIEQTLDEVFSGLWRTKNFQYKVVVNEILGDLDLEVYHPLLREWIGRSGTAAVPITVKKGSDFTDVNNKYVNACVTVLPHVKAECIKNAAKSLGALFGRNLNRNEDFWRFESMSERMVPEHVMQEADEKLATCNNSDEVKVLLSTYEDNVSGDYAFKQLFYKRIQELNNEKT